MSTEKEKKSRSQVLTDLVGKDIPAADYGNYGLRIFGFHEYEDGDIDVIVQDINWETGDPIGPIGEIDAFKMSYRYDEYFARDALVTPE
jgi:hypothetical protein